MFERDRHPASDHGLDLAEAPGGAIRVPHELPGLEQGIHFAPIMSVVNVAPMVPAHGAVPLNAALMLARN